MTFARLDPTGAPSYSFVSTKQSVWIFGGSLKQREAAEIIGCYSTCCDDFTSARKRRHGAEPMCQQGWHRENRARHGGRHAVSRGWGVLARASGLIVWGGAFRWFATRWYAYRITHHEVNSDVSLRDHATSWELLPMSDGLPIGYGAALVVGCAVAIPIASWRGGCAFPLSKFLLFIYFLWAAELALVFG